MIVNPGIRRFLGSAIQRLFNSASFYAPLTHSLALERGTGSPTFTRASTATVMGYGPTDNAVDGLKLLTVAANEARFVGARRISEGVWSNTFADGSLIPAATNTGYLAEGARTNLCLQSENLSTTWVAASLVSFVADQYVAPNGTTTMDQVLATAGNGGHYFSQASLTTTAAAYTYSVYLRYVNHRYVALILNDAVGNFYASFDLLNGTAGAVTAGVTSTITQVSTGVYRVTLTKTVAAAAGTAVVYGVMNNSDNAGIDTWNAAGTEAIGWWGAQVELGSSASAYIATTTAAVSRAADVLTYPSAGNVSGTVGAAYCEIKTGSVCGRSLSFNAGGTGMIDAGTGDSLSFRAYDETNVVNVTAGDSSASTVKQAIAWGGSTLSAARNGTTASGSFDGNMSPTGISIGGTTGGELNGTIRNVRIWNRQLSASEMQAITA